MPRVQGPAIESDDNRRLRRSAAELGLKVSQFSVLNAIASREGAQPAELAKALEMDESYSDVVLTPGLASGIISAM